MRVNAFFNFSTFQKENLLIFVAQKTCGFLWLPMIILFLADKRSVKVTNGKMTTASGVLQSFLHEARLQKLRDLRLKSNKKNLLQYWILWQLQWGHIFISTNLYFFNFFCNMKYFCFLICLRSSVTEEIDWN